MAGAVHLGPPAEEREQGNSLTPSRLQDFFPQTRESTRVVRGRCRTL